MRETHILDQLYFVFLVQVALLWCLLSQYLNMLKKLQACLLSIVSCYLVVCTEDVKCSNCGKYSPDQHHTDNHAGGGGEVVDVLVGCPPR